MTADYCPYCANRKDFGYSYRRRKADALFEVARRCNKCGGTGPFIAYDPQQAIQAAAQEAAVAAWAERRAPRARKPKPATKAKKKGKAARPARKGS